MPTLELISPQNCLCQFYKKQVAKTQILYHHERDTDRVHFKKHDIGFNHCLYIYFRQTPMIRYLYKIFAFPLFCVTYIQSEYVFSQEICWVFWGFILGFYIADNSLIKINKLQRNSKFLEKSHPGRRQLNVNDSSLGRGTPSHYEKSGGGADIFSVLFFKITFFYCSLLTL